ncbi:MAG: hypothetical protein J6Y02_19180 [Pseudobutyrivibrio sp.]|nr:hypothetical protein [Pseudobutyrivibrio sp.]
MSNSILNTIKQMLGVEEEQTDFDMDIIIHINTALNILHQLGVGDEWIQIDGPSTEWDEITTDLHTVQMIKTWMYDKVKLMFDPPINSTLISSMERQIAELEWRIVDNHCDKEATK